MDDPLGFGNFNSQALHPSDEAMNSGAMPSRTAHAAAGPSGLEGFLVRNAPAIGGTIGAVAAAPLNLLDAVSGVGGTALDVGAAGLGGSLGQEIKNKYDPSQASNPLKEGSIQGASELAGLGVGKIASKGISAVKGAAPDLFKSAFNIPGKLAARLRPTETAQKMLDYGVGNGSLQSMMDTSDNAMDILDGAYRQSIQQIKTPLDINPAIDAANGVIKSPYSTDMTAADKKAVIDNITSIGAQGPLPFKINPQDGVDSMRALQKVGHQLLAKGENKLNPVPRLSQMGQSYLAAADSIQSQLDNLGGSASVKAVQSDANKKALSEISPKLADEFMAAKSPQEVRSLMSPFYNLKSMANLTKLNPAKTGLLTRAAGGAAGFGIGGIPGAVAGMLGSPVLEGIENAIRAPLTTNAARAVNVAGNVAGKAGSNNGKDLIGNLTARDIAGKAATQQVGAGVGNLINQPPGQGQPSNATTGGPVGSMVASQVGQLTSSIQSAAKPQQPPIQMITPEQEQQILQTSGVDGLRAVLDTQSTNLAIQKQEYPELSTEQQTQILDTTKALQGVQALAQLYDNASAMGAGAGTLSELGTHIPGIQNTKAESALRTYEDNRGDLAATIANVLGSGRSSAAMINQIKAELPVPTDSPQAAQQKFSLVLSRLNSAMSGTLATPATNTPGQLTNFAGQSIPGLDTSLGSGGGQTADTGNMGLLNFIGAQ